jgi:hypothetical protein
MNSDIKKEYLPKEENLEDPDEKVQLQPLITKNLERNASYNKTIFDLKFKNFNDEEESTKILRLVSL